ncbi:dipeptide/oligopeptide/nickel ABC transporter ATP-binding protein [Paenibacillus sambharensis]|uniref:Dipeptide/oligopeptide/nickel ABC transporter ATP-binding protein n=1 Tax=Paenibacillus sambharensis TaxID=1803190 RepID=A0A2W1LF91_9BACL|nr:dipeptide ABC transporter ATP-binding protein [Paenibacillus sambharensis]PZD97359.1 dipeptide/oligopeptide/nickel ABC transporter ATP-binding protein [Paenibacillus sambharensis]
MQTTILEVNELRTYFPIRKGILQRTAGYVKAVDGVSFRVNKGEVFGIVGESGCGKSTTGRSILQLIKPTGGEVIFEGQDVTRLNEEAMRRLRRDMQIVFQDPFASLNPRHKVSKILEEPLLVHGFGTVRERREKVAELIETVGLNASQLERYPHQFSGGQRQRIAIARALMLRPKLIIADEPVSALDVSIQSQILNLMQDLQQSFQLTYVFIAHDLSVIKHFCDRVAVMYLGQIVEMADKESLYSEPRHPYTKALLSAVPNPDPEGPRERIILEGEVPSPANMPQGCVFHTRCPMAEERCRHERPVLEQTSHNHAVACHLYASPAV